MRIVDLDLTNESAIQQVAAMLVESFATNWPEAWPDMESAQEGVRESFAADRISRIALDQDRTVLVWVGGRLQYRGHVWELQPLVVRVMQHRQGSGRALVADLEERVKERGGLTITLGTDDVNQQTSLAGIDLFPNVWEHVAHIKNLKLHPYEFHQKQGYVIIRSNARCEWTRQARYPYGQISCEIGI